MRRCEEAPITAWSAPEGRSTVKLMSLPRTFVAVAAALVLTPSALAAPPPNDNRASAEVIPSFPFDAHGTLVEATVERLDPQVSECGSIASTVWYRIEVAPDGILTASVGAGGGVAPVLRLYRQGRSAISEVDCGVAPAGG